MEWKEYKYTDLCTLIGGGTPKTSESSYWGGDIPWLSVKDFGNDGKYVYSTEKTITETGLNNSSTKLLKKDDIIISARGTIGAIAMLSSEMAFNQSCFGIRSNELVDQHYLYYLTKTKIAELQKNSHGSVFDTITRETFAKLDCQIPPIELQKVIASILSALDDKIEVNRRINDNFYYAFFEVMLIWLLTSLENDNLEQQVQALFRSWFVDFEPFKDGDFVESELGVIPKGWRTGTLSDLGEVVGGSTPSKVKPEFYTDNGIAWLTPKDLSVSQLKFTSKGEIDITKEGYDSCSTKLMPKGTVLFSSRAPIGYITIAKNDICTNQGFKSVIPTLAGTAFIYCFLKEVTQEIENKATGSTFKEASGALMKSLPTIIPESEVFNEFENLMSPIFKQQETVEEEISRLASLRDTLLPKLMSGELILDNGNV